MKKNYKISAMFLLLVNLICAFTPYTLIRKRWEYDPNAKVFHGIARKVGENACGLLDVNTTVGRILVWFVILLWIVCIISIIVSILKNKEHKILYLFPGICLIVFVLTVLYITGFANIDTASYRYDWAINWMFYISIGLQIAAAVVMFIAKSAKGNSVVKQENQGLGNASKILEYKELLDCGIISQEEFEEKKKQLLDM